MRTSPTAYDVVTAYSVTSTFLSNGFCTTSSTISILPTAISTIVPSASGQLVISPEEEEYFINQLGFSSCSGAIESVTPMAHIQISNLTVSSTKFVSRVTAAAAVTTGAATSSSSTSSAPTSSSSPSPSASSTLSTASSTISSRCVVSFFQLNSLALAKILLVLLQLVLSPSQLSLSAMTL